MAAPRPFGVGPYGTGPYSRYRDPGVVVVGGATGIAFNAHAAATHFLYLGAASSITFSVRAVGVQRLIRAQAITEIVFSTRALLAWTWASYAPCEPGTWSPADPCEGGSWTPPPGCGVGTWTPVRHP